MSGRVDAQKEVVKERVGEDRCNVQILCFQSCSVCRFIPVEFPAPLDNMVQCDVTIARGNVSFTPGFMQMRVKKRCLGVCTPFKCLVLS